MVWYAGGNCTLAMISVGSSLPASAARECFVCIIITVLILLCCCFFCLFVMRLFSHSGCAQLIKKTPKKVGGGGN